MKPKDPEILKSEFVIRRGRFELRITNYDFLISFLLALAGLLLYLRTLAPDVVDADGGEFQFAAWNFSFVHPTGYPLFLILGGAFQHLLPIGNPAYRLNVFTALTAALALAAVYLAAKEIAGRAPAIIAAASLGLTSTFWSDAGAAETYDLGALFVALLIYLALCWQVKPSAGRFAAFCLALGLALTNHRTVLLWGPGLLLFLAIAGWRSRAQFSVRKLAPAAVLFVLPLLLYLYIPLRAPSSPYAELPLSPGHDLVLYENSPVGLVNYLMGRVFQYELAWDAVSDARMVEVPQLLLEQFGLVGCVLGLAGLASMIWKREWARLVMLALGFGMTVVFAAAYHIGDIFHYFIPAYLVWALLIGSGAAGLAGLATRIFGPARGHQAGYAVLACAGLLFLPFQFVSNWSSADRSQETRERDQWTRILAQPIQADAVLISNDRDEMMPLWYMQYVEGTRRDVIGLFPLITREARTADIAGVAEVALASGRPVYFVKPMPGIEDRFCVTKAPVLWQVTCDTFPPPQHSSGADLGDSLELVGYDSAESQGSLAVTLYWKTLARLNGDYTAFVQLADSSGKLAQGTDHQIGGDYYPSSLWKIGEVVRDEQTLALPASMAPGTYRLVLGMYHYPEMISLGDPLSIPIEWP